MFNEKDPWHFMATFTCFAICHEFSDNMFISFTLSIPTAYGVGFRVKLEHQSHAVAANRNLASQPISGLQNDNLFHFFEHSIVVGIQCRHPLLCVPTLSRGVRVSFTVRNGGPGS